MVAQIDYYPMNRPVNLDSGILTQYSALMLFMDSYTDEQVDNGDGWHQRDYLADMFGDGAVKACVYNGYINKEWFDREQAYLYGITHLGRTWVDNTAEIMIDFVTSYGYTPESVKGMAEERVAGNLTARMIDMETPEGYEVKFNINGAVETMKFMGVDSHKRAYNLIDGFPDEMKDSGKVTVEAVW